MKDYNKIYEAERIAYIEELKELLKYESVSTDSKHDGDCIACAEWLKNRYAKAGFEAELLKTHSKPVVYAEKKGDPNKPVVLYYGHYDVQPVDPIEKWDTGPFEPTIKGDRIYGRGAQDNKGQLFYALLAFEEVSKEEGCPTIKILIEGEEESGSQGISRGLPEWKEKIAADVLMVTDTSTVGSGAPTIIMGLRGLIHLTVVLTGPDHDLHSGTHGGMAPNAAEEIARLVASLHNDDGSIAVKGYYDQVRKPNSEEEALANEFGINEDEYIQATGVAPVAGEKDYTPVERTGFRPSIDINGIYSGYYGEGVKTVLPMEGSAKITSRLVPDQEPQECLDAIIKHLEENVPDGMSLTIPEKGVSGPGFRLDPNSELTTKAVAVLDTLSDQKTAFLWEGASIPIVTALSNVSGAEPLLCGFGSLEDNVHAPNESFSLSRFKLGFMYCCKMLTEL